MLRSISVQNVANVMEAVIILGSSAVSFLCKCDVSVLCDKVHDMLLNSLL